MSESDDRDKTDPFAAVGVATHDVRRGSFVGRDESVTLLLESVQHAGGYASRVVLVLGERGVGKTRLAAEVATRAEERGARVVWGRAWEGGSVPDLWPWSQVLRAIAAQLPRVARRHRAVLDQLGSGVTTETSRTNPGPPLELFEGSLSLLTDAASRLPLLVILDDLHLADERTIALLQFVSQDMGKGRFVVLATCRDEEVAGRPRLATALGGLDQRTRYITLAPLGKEAVRAYLYRSTAAEPSDALVDHVWERSGGNAFFLDKIGALYASAERSGGAAVPSVPPGVREEVIGYRLAGLSDDCRRILAIASVLGREFSVDILERVLARPSSTEAMMRGRLMGAINEAASARLLREIERDGSHRYGFAHGLVRDALYEQLPTADRRQLHRAAGEALAALAPRAAANELEEVANHFDRSDSAEAAAQVAAYAAAAAAAHERNGHCGLAARSYERALAALDRSAANEALESSRQRCEWLLQLAAARRRAGDRDGAGDATRRAAKHTRALAPRMDGESAADLLIRAAVEYSAGRAWSRMGIGHDDEFLLLHDALGRLPEGDGTLRARALGQVAREFWHTGVESGRWREALSREAVAMARRTGNLDALAHTVECHHIAAWSAETLGERLALSAELITLARHLPHLELRARAHLLRGLNLLEAGAMVEMGRELHLCSQLAREIGADPLAWHADVVRASHAACEGRLGDAERLAQQALEMGQRIQSDDAEVFFGVHFYTLRRLQGRFEELLPLARAFAEQFPTLPVWRVGVADLYALLGRQREAWEEFEYFAAADFAEPPPDWQWLLAMALLSEVCAFLGDRRRAALLYERLLPFCGQNVTTVPGLSCIGSASYHLGLLATTLEQWTDAARHFEAAIERNIQMGALPYAAHAQRQYAAALMRQPGCWEASVDGAKAAGLLEESRVTYERLGMDAYAEQTRLLRVRLARLGAAPTSAVAQPGENALYLERGRWTVVWQGRRVQFRNLLGLQYIAYLIRCSPEAVHVAELEAACGDRRAVQPPPSVRRAGLRAEGLAIRRRPASSVSSDRRARDEYAARLQALKSELAEAEDNHDLGRIEVLSAERDAIARAIAGAFRRLDPDDRQRKRIWSAIYKTAMPKIRAEIPDLAAHLVASLTTGTLCSYQPNLPVRWNLEGRTNS